MKAKRPAANHVGNGRQRPARPELERGPDGIAHGEFEQASEITVAAPHHSLQLRAPGTAAGTLRREQIIGRRRDRVGHAARQQIFESTLDA